MKVNQVLSLVVVGLAVVTAFIEIFFHSIFLILPLWIFFGVITFLLFPKSEGRKFHADRPWTWDDTGTITVFALSGPISLLSITLYIMAEKRAAKLQGH